MALYTVYSLAIASYTVAEMSTTILHGWFLAIRTVVQIYSSLGLLILLSFDQSSYQLTFMFA